MGFSFICLILILEDVNMSINLVVGNTYAAKNYLESGYSFSEGEYTQKILSITKMNLL